MTALLAHARKTANRGVPARASPLFNPFEEQDYMDLLVSAVRSALAGRSGAIQKQAVARLNARITARHLPVLPASHEWSALDKRLLFFRYYAEAMDQLGPGSSTEQVLIETIVGLEIEYERTSGTHHRAYQDLVSSQRGRKFRPPDPPRPEREPEMDEETRKVIARHQVNEKVQAYIASLSKGREHSDQAFSVLVLAYIGTLSDLSIPLSLEYQDQQKRAEDHSWIEWMQANEFPWQHEKLFPVLDGLLMQARERLRAKDFDAALERLSLAQNLFDHLARLMHDYYSTKVRRGSRVVILLSVLKSISRMIASIIVLRSVKGAVSQFVALATVNLVYQQLDRAVGARSRGLSGTEAVRDAAAEMLLVKVTGKISQVMATRFRIDPESISFSAMNILAGTVIGSLEEEFIKLGRGVTFVGFLQNLRAKFTNPEVWVETIVVAVIARRYPKDAPTVSLPMNKTMARAAVVSTALLVAPKAAAAEAPGKPAVMEVGPRATPAPSAVKSAKPSAVERATPDSRAAPAPTKASSTPAARATAPATSPGPQQRATGPAAQSPNRAPTDPDPVPPMPLGGLALIGMAVVVAKGPRRGRVLNLFQQARKLLDKIDDPDWRRRCEQRLDQLRKEYDKTGNHADTEEKIGAVRNKINEIFAEEQIDFHLRHNLPAFGVKSIVDKVAVPRRGKSGPEIIDMVYKVVTLSGKTAYLIVESKYGSSRLGWVRFGRRKVRQFSAEWFEMRIEEIRLQRPRFADGLEDSWKKGQILPFVLKIAADGGARGFYDYTAAWNKYYASRP